jgi:predicted DNA-binding transcriptional regulator AlpA
VSTPETTAEWVSAEQLAHHLSISVDTVWRLRDQGMPSVKLSPGKTGARRFNVAEVEQWLRDRGEQPA